LYSFFVDLLISLLVDQLISWTGQVQFLLQKLFFLLRFANHGLRKSGDLVKIIFQ